MQVQPVTDVVKNDAENIRTAAASEYDRIRNRGELNAQAIQIMLARVFVKQKQAMDALRERAYSGADATSRRTYQSVFGVENFPGDRASVSISYRDAQDRIAGMGGIDEYTTVNALFTRAENSGDELLSRAIAQRAFDDPSAGWDEFLERYCAARPAAQQAVAKLRNAQVEAARVASSSVFAFVLPTPSELAGLDEYKIQSLAANTLV